MCLSAGLQHDDVAHDVNARSVHRAAVGFANVGYASIVENEICIGDSVFYAVFVKYAAGDHALIWP